MDRQTLDIYDEKAAEYARLVDGDAAADTQLSRFLEHMPPGSNLWDLGCGPGRSSGLMAAAGHSVLATDASAEMLALAAQQLGVVTRRETFDEIHGTAEYDGIFANFSLLHADEGKLPDHIQAIGAALKPGGIFHIGMKTGAGTYRDKIGRRYTYVTDDELTELLSAAGLSVLDTWHGNTPGLSGETAPWAVMQARKNG